MIKSGQFRNNDTTSKKVSGGSKNLTLEQKCKKPSSIYSCSIDHILEHEFCHLGCWAVSEKFLKRRNFCLSMLLFGVVFSTF